MGIRQIIAPVSGFISQKNLLKWTGRNVIFPFYHTISDDHLPYISNLYPLRSIKNFKLDLEYFCKHFDPIGIEEVYHSIASKTTISKPSFHLTFDDGLKEVYDVIAPFLEEKGIPATFFVNTDFVDNKKLFYRYKVGLILEKLKKINNDQQEVETVLRDHSKWTGNLKSSLMQLNYHDQNLIEEIAQHLNLDFAVWLSENKPYLTSRQIKDLLGRGFKIGSHSIDHPRFKNIDLEQQKNQIKESFDFLMDNFGLDERLFSFPFGDEGVSAELFDWMYEDGKCKMSFGVSGIKDDYCPFHLHRIPMDDCHGNSAGFIKSEYLYYMLKGVFNKNRIHRV